MQGEHWAVAFASGGAVAVFYSSESARNPFPKGRQPCDQARYFQGMPERLAAAKDDALSQMHDENYLGDNPRGAVITAAMWADGERFTSAEPWEVVLDNSLWACRTHLLPPTASLREWLPSMNPSGSGERAALSIFERRITSQEEMIELEAWELQAVIEAAGPHIDPMKWAAACLLLDDVGVALPNPPQQFDDRNDSSPWP